MLKEFRAFLIKQNMLALAIAVVIGAATNDVVQGLVNDFIMPIVNAISPPTGDEKPATRDCPFCRQAIDARATRCAYCTSQLAAA
jgi:hypothetical protein